MTKARRTRLRAQPVLNTRGVRVGERRVPKELFAQPL